jgi:rod shape-determining protein MreC
MFSLLRKYQTLIIASFLVGLALSVYSSRHAATDTTPFFRRLFLTAYSPPLMAITFVVKKIRYVWDNYILLVGTQKKNRELQKTVDLLREQTMSLQEVRAENDRLRRLLSLKERLPMRTISAEIIGRDPLEWFKAVLINKGQNDGVKKNQAVTTHQGVVGRTLEVASDCSKVLLITDTNSSVDAMVQRTRARGIVGGRASHLCELQYFASSDDVQRGDLVITSGLCGIFPKGLAVGRVGQVEKDPFGLFRYIELVPSASLNKLEEVSVLLGDQQ